MPLKRSTLAYMLNAHYVLILRELGGSNAVLSKLANETEHVSVMQSVMRPFGLSPFACQLFSKEPCQAGCNSSHQNPLCILQARNSYKAVQGLV